MSATQLELERANGYILASIAKLINQQNRTSKNSEAMKHGNSKA